MAYETRSQSTTGGLDFARALAIVFALPFVGAPLLLGTVWLLIWLLLNRRWSLSQRWIALAFALSLLPALLTWLTQDQSPVSTYLDTYQKLGVAAIRRAIGLDDTFRPGVTLASYGGAVAPMWLATSVLAAIAIGWLTRAKQSTLRRRDSVAIDVPRRVEKKLAKGVTHPAGGWAIGYTPDGKPLIITDQQARQHVVVCGTTGSGKTTVLRHLLDGVTKRCPTVVLDCKASQALRRTVAAIPGSITWTIGGDVQWDALRGNPTELANKLLAAERFGPNAAIYRAAAERYVQWVGQVLAWTGEPHDPQLIADLLQPKALTAKLREVRSRADEPWWQRCGAPLLRKVENMGKAEDEGVSGFAARFGVVTEGAAAASLGTGHHTFALEEAIRAGRTVLFSLDAAAYPTLAPKIGAWVLMEMVRAAGALQEDAWGDGQQCYFVIDEFSALKEEGRHVVPVLARAREAGIGCVVATQGLADLAAVDRVMPQQIVQNAGVRILLRQGSSEDAQAWARHSGEYEREEWNRHFDSMGEKSWSTHWRREFYVSPDELRVLRIGEAVVWVAPVGRQNRWIGRVRIAPPSPFKPPTPAASPLDWGGAQVIAAPAQGVSRFADDQPAA